MTVREPIHWCAAAAAYLVGVTTVGLLTVKLASLVAGQAIALTQPYLLGTCPCLPSLVEQRRIAAQVAAPPVAARTESRVAAVEAPAISVDVLAAQMDLAEREDRLMPAAARPRRASR